MVRMSASSEREMVCDPTQTPAFSPFRSAFAGDMVSLNLSTNALAIIPPGFIAPFTALEQLFVSHNQISVFPAVLGSLKVVVARSKPSGSSFM